MGVLVRWEKPTIESSWNQVKIYRATTRAGTYSLVNTMDIGDSAYYDKSGSSASWYQLTFYDSLNSLASDYSMPMPAFYFTNYCTVKQVQDFLNLFTAVSAEAVATGDGAEDEFALDYGALVEGTEKVYVAGTQKSHDTDYYIDYDRGYITFVTPPTTAAITADYKYSDPTSSIISDFILRAEDEINRLAGRSFYAPAVVTEFYSGNANADSSFWQYDSVTFLNTADDYRVPDFNLTKNYRFQLRRFPVKSVKWFVKNVVNDITFDCDNVNSNTAFGSSTWLSQPFVATTTEVLKASLFLRWSSSTMQPLTVEIWSSASGKPSAMLASTTIDTIENVNYEWVDAVFDYPVTVVAGTTYHLVVYSTSAGSTSVYNWGSYTSGAYAGGVGCTSTNSGAAWTANATTNRAFMVWSGEVVSGKDYVIDKATGTVTFTKTGGLKFTNGLQNFCVQYSHGYDSVPRAVEELAVKSVAKRVIESRLLGNPSQSLNIQAQNAGVLDKDIKELWVAVGRYFELKPVTQ